MNIKHFLLPLFSLFCFVGFAQTKVTDAMVHEIITDCVSRTGGFIVKEDVSENQDKEIHIALPNDYSHYEITKALKPLMMAIENWYHPFKPWKVLDDGKMCSFNVAKDESKRSLTLVYRPENCSLVIHDSPSNSINIPTPESLSYSEYLQNTVVWGAINALDGFIREEEQENISPEDIQYRVRIQLQKDATLASVISGLKPVTAMLGAAYYLSQPWKQEDYGGVECKFFAELENEKKNMLIHFYYHPKPQVLTINFVTGLVK